MATTRGTTVRKWLGRSAKYAAVGFIVWMWFFAFVLASRESANNIKDPAWSDRAEATCATAKAARGSLADLSRIDPKDPAVVRRKAQIVDQATDTIEATLDALAKDPPSTDKGKELVPEWIRDYRSYVRDRREYAASLRTGVISEFSESQIEGIPISEKLGKFARENHMPSCQPPRDLQA